MNPGQIFSGMRQAIPYARYVEQQQGSSLLEQAKAKYPYMKDANLGFVMTPDDIEKTGHLEYWSSREPGTPQRPRPFALPLGQSGLQVFNPNVRLEDIFGDYVSHEAVETDPKLKAMYEKFTKSVPDTTMRARYQMHQKRQGENRPYELWRDLTGLPEYFRGYVFNQWENPRQLYNREQLQQLDKIKQYIGIE